MRTEVLVSEIQKTFRSEQPLQGRPTVLVRTGGCDSRCSWCDVKNAVLPEYRSNWVKMEPEKIWEQIQFYSPRPILITLTGGNPAIEPFEPLLKRGWFSGYTFALETQGTICQPWFTKIDHLIFSPHPPSSGMKFREDRFERCFETASKASRCNLYFKIVVFEEEDYQFARTLAQKYVYMRFFLQVGRGENFLERVAWLKKRVQEDYWNEVRVFGGENGL